MKMKPFCGIFVAEKKAETAFFFSLNEAESCLSYRFDTFTYTVS